MMMMKIWVVWHDPYHQLCVFTGTVIAAGQSLYLSPDVNAFRARGSSPTGKQGLQVQGPYSPSLSGGASVTLTDASGNTLDTKRG